MLEDVLKDFSWQLIQRTAEYIRFLERLGLRVIKRLKDRNDLPKYFSIDQFKTHLYPDTPLADWEAEQEVSTSLQGIHHKIYQEIEESGDIAIQAEDDPHFVLDALSAYEFKATALMDRPCRYFFHQGCGLLPNNCYKVEKEISSTNGHSFSAKSYQCQRRVQRITHCVEKRCTSSSSKQHPLAEGLFCRRSAYDI